MEGYLTLLAFLALAGISLFVIESQEARSRRLRELGQGLQRELSQSRRMLRDREESLDHLSKDSAQLLKWRKRAAALEEELLRVKRSEAFTSAERLRFLEEHLAQGERWSGIRFLDTFPSQRSHSFEEQLQSMIEMATYEIVIVSPWIKMQPWQRLSGPLCRFSRRGGSLRVFMRGADSDYSNGMSDDLNEEIKSLGGQLVAVSGLHAKIYMADRREAIIGSPNLTRGGTEANIESGVWISDPATMKEICGFIDGLSRL